MDKDIVIYVKETRDIIAIITNTELNKYSQIIANNKIEIEEVSNRENYIISDYETGKIKFTNPNSNILFLDDYR